MSFCFVIQPFDGGGEFDKRYEQIFVPAIRASNLEPYRVDKDPGVNVVIHEIENKIKKSAICLADITRENPNVWYEIGFATASEKNVIFVCEESVVRFPFDIQHRKIVRYKKDSPEDFIRLQENITERIDALLSKDEAIKNIQVSPIIETLELSEREIVILATIMGNRTAQNDAVSDSTIMDDMDRAGYTKFASNLAIQKLLRKGMLEKREWMIDDNYNSYQASGYALTKIGEDWLINNEDKFQLKIERKPSPIKLDDFDDNIPF